MRQRRIGVTRDAFQAGARVYVVEKVDGKRYVGRLIMEEVEEGSSPPPTFFLDDDEMGSFAEELAASGYRQKDAVLGSPKALDEARREHIADLRKAAKLT